MDFTKEQAQAIYSRGENILVSAGAGAGKTRVLVTRISELILDPENPVSADQLLVLTFTKAAAREMKERITAELDRRLEEDPGNRYLRQQIRVVKHADISTVHSFCNHLIRTHFNELGIDPTFRIGEDGELKMMQQEAMEELLEQCYEEGSDSFLRLVEAYAPDRDDSAIEKMIRSLHEFSTGFADAKGWLDRTLREFETMTTEEGIENSYAMGMILKSARNRILALKTQLSRWEGFLDGQKDLKRISAVHAKDQEIVDSLLEARDFSTFYETIHQVSFDSYPRGTNAEKQWPYFEEAKKIHDQVVSSIDGLLEQHFLKSTAQLRIEQRRLDPLMKEFVSLCRRYQTLYFDKKKEKNIYEFNDLEQFTLRLLVDHYEEDGKPIPSQMAAEIAQNYRAIFVDEYQDTNLVQETIIEMLLQSGKGELFVVGDVKQSIYRFRQARPDLFLDRYRRYEEGEGIKIELRDNFRSSPDVLDFCNLFFRRWMKEDFGGIDYNDEVCLRAGEHGPMAQVHEKQEALILIKDEEADNMPEDIDKILAESAMIGKRIEELLEEGYQFEDMVILLRTMKGTGEIIASYLESRKIPVICESQVGYFQTREIQVILNYLSVIDNVYLDIPMASVMLSGIGGFRSEDLARLKILVERGMRKDYSLYELLSLYLLEGEDQMLREKIAAFLSMLEEYRRKKQEMLLHELIWDIYQKTGFYEEVLLMPHGRKRRENLMMLLKKAEEYEKTVFKGLFYFVRYMEQLRIYEVEPGGTSAAESVEKAVRIMTIHKSKGLEFPVVFVSVLHKKFNDMDTKEWIQYHPELGIGMEQVDVEERTHGPSILKNAIKERLRQEMMEEELRVLYVAMTRAERKVILTGIAPEKKIAALEDGSGLNLPAGEAKCLLDWVLPVVYDQGNWSKCTKYHYHQILEILQEKKETEKEMTFEDLFASEMTLQADSAPVEKAFAHRYDYEECVNWKRKYSVSELKKISMRTLPDEEPVVWEKSDDEIAKPRFLSEESEMTSTAYGTVVHKVMELLPFSQIHSKKELFDHMESIWKHYPDLALTLRKRIYVAVENFLFSEIGERLSRLDAAGRIHKEYPFTIALDASVIYPQSQRGESIVLQGVIDLYGEDEDGLLLLDYKTDRIDEGQESILLDRYQSQMLYYRLALEQMLEKKVDHCWIYSFALREFIEISWDK